jgi:hypothetical protein
MVASSEWRVACGKVNAPFGEGVNGDNRMEWSWMHVHLPREDLTWMALFDSSDTIFKDRWPKVPDAQYLLGCSKPGQMTTTSS